MKVDSLGKALGGVIAVLFLVVYLTLGERRANLESELILGRDPTVSANAAFARGEHRFREVWRYVPRAKNSTGAWHVPGSDHIPTALLLRFPARDRIETSWHIELSPDAESFSRAAWRWAETYNRQLATLILAEQRAASPTP